MNYYVLQNDKIALFDTNKSRLQTTLKFKPELADEKIHQTTKEIVELNGKYVFADEHQEERLEKAKADKLAELSSVAGQYDQYKCDDMYVTSSIGGYKFNADIRSQTNMQGLVLVLPAGGTTRYKDFNNEFQTVSKEQFEIMIAECKQNGLNLYQQKFTFESQINACTTIDEVQAIKIQFEMLDFSKSE